MQCLKFNFPSIKHKSFYRVSSISPMPNRLICIRCYITAVMARATCRFLTKSLSYALLQDQFCHQGTPHHPCHKVARQDSQQRRHRRQRSDRSFLKIAIHIYLTAKRFNVYVFGLLISSFYCSNIPDH